MRTRRQELPTPCNARITEPPPPESPRRACLSSSLHQAHGSNHSHKSRQRLCVARWEHAKKKGFPRAPHAEPVEISAGFVPYNQGHGLNLFPNVKNCFIPHSQKDRRVFFTLLRKGPECRMGPSVHLLATVD